MPRDLPLGNGSLLITFDGTYQLRDLYWPYVGSENHTDGHVFRVGLWVDGLFTWLDDQRWRRELRYASETLVTEVELDTIVKFGSSSTRTFIFPATNSGTRPTMSRNAGRFITTKVPVGS